MNARHLAAKAPLFRMGIVSLAILVCMPVLFPGNLQAADAENCMKCHRYPGLAAAGEDGVQRNFWVDEEKYRHSIHGRLLCTSCHSDVKQIPHKAANRVDCSNECHAVDPSTKKVFTHRPIVEQFSQSAHGKRKPGLEGDYPTCIFCHQNAMYFTEIDDERSEGFRRCGACHEDRRWGSRFFNHLFFRMDGSRTGKEIVALCGSCHGDSRMMARHGLKTLQVKTYEESFHGVARKLGARKVAHCVSCHGTHDIQPAKDPLSSVNTRNVPKTCGKCHRGATPNYAVGKMHVDAKTKEAGVVYYTAQFFKWLTIGTMLALIVHIILDMYGRSRRLRGEQ